MGKAIFFIVLGICLIELVVIFALLNKKKPMHAASLIAITFGIVGLIHTYQNRNLIFKHSEKNISQVEQNNNDNKNILIKKKADSYHRGPYEVNSIEDVPEEFYRHVYYLYRRPTDGKCVFCSDYTISPDRILLDVEDDTFFYFVCTKEITDKILEIHKSNGGPGSGWEYWE